MSQILQNLPPQLETFELAALERRMPLWQKIEERFNKRLAELRASNDARTKGRRETAFVRGQIAMAKEILALGKDNPIAD